MDVHELFFPPGATRYDWLIDGAIAVALVLVAVPVVWFGGGEASLSYLGCSAATIFPLIWRRHSPILSLAGVTVAALVQLALIEWPTPSLVAIPVVSYTMARWIRGYWARLAIVVGGIGSVLGPLRWLAQPITNASFQQGASVLLGFTVCMGLVVTPYAIGRRTREASEARQQLVDQASERYRALLVEREQQARIAESRARTQIARELHDIVAHSLSVIIVQAEGGRAAAAKRPETATQALTTIAETGREALTEMRHILGVLRADPDPDPEVDFAPMPRLADIPELVARTSDRARLKVKGRPPHVSQVMELTVFRVVQEALTNVLKHAGPDATARVTISYGPQAITVDVVDDGVGQAEPSHPPGHGLRGMNERVAAMGGKLIARPRPRGGFQVTATLPLAGTGSQAATGAEAAVEPATVADEAAGFVQSE